MIIWYGKKNSGQYLFIFIFYFPGNLVPFSLMTTFPFFFPPPPPPPSAERGGGRPILERGKEWESYSTYPLRFLDPRAEQRGGDQKFFHKFVLSLSFSGSCLRFPPPRIPHKTSFPIFSPFCAHLPFSRNGKRKEEEIYGSGSRLHVCTRERRNKEVKLRFSRYSSRGEGGEGDQNLRFETHLQIQKEKRNSSFFRKGIRFCSCLWKISYTRVGFQIFPCFSCFLKENWESQSSISNKKINPNFVHILQRHLFFWQIE